MYINAAANSAVLQLSFSFCFLFLVEAGVNPAYRTSAFEAVCTLTPF
jgi:hypothetical protein